jgi:hypothetical protein
VAVIGTGFAQTPEASSTIKSPASFIVVDP